MSFLKIVALFRAILPCVRTLVELYRNGGNILDPEVRQCLASIAIEFASFLGLSQLVDELKKLFDHDHADLILRTSNPADVELSDVEIMQAVEDLAA